MTPIACLIAATLAQSPAIADWKPVKPADGSFTAELPAEPRHAGRDIAGPQGLFRHETDTCTFDGAGFSIEATRHAGPIPGPTRAATLERAVTDYLAIRKGEVVEDSEIAVDGRPGRDLTIRRTIQSATVTTRFRIILDDQALYYLSVVSAVDRPLPGPTGRFLRSFRLEARPTITIADATPEQALRTFLLALAAQDEPALEAITLPSAELDRLMNGKPATATQAVAMRMGMAVIPIRSLKVGDTFTLPGRKEEQAVPPEDVADDRAVLLPKDAPVPTRLRKVDGRWKVDARPFIAARKAVDAAKARAKAKKGT